MKKRVFLTMSLGLIALILSLLWYERAHSPLATQEGDHETIPVLLRSPEGEFIDLAVEIADEPEERRVGLMGRPSMSGGQGMLFIFEEEKPLSFWMKDTLIPLDILFFDAQGRFVSRVAMPPCEKDPCPSYPSAGPATYALEVNKGEERTLEVGPGWSFEH